MSLIPQLTDAGRGLLISALSGTPLNFTRIKIGNGAAPEEPKDGDYWYDTENHTLNRYSERWDESPRNITVGENPPETAGEGDLWYNTDDGKLYYFGAGWKTSSANIACSTTQPEEPVAGDYWYDTANEILYVFGNKWNTEATVNITAATQAPDAPADGDFWYDSTNHQLKICASLWGEKQGVNITVDDEAPASPSQDDYWYDTESEKLFKFGNGWKPSETEITVGSEEPESPAENDYWYDTENDALKKYDGEAWQADAQTITVSAEAPSEPSTGDWWYDSASNALKEYGTTWNEDSSVTISAGATEPQEKQLGDWWYDTGANALKEYAKSWQNDTTHTFNYGNTAPETPNIGDWWYDNSLHVYGTGWIASNKPFTYGSVAPSTPAAENWWYDTSTGTLREYNDLFQEDTGDTFTYSATAPARAYEEDLWYDTTEGVLKTYATGWVPDTEQPFTYGQSAPATPTAGDWWYSTELLQLYEYNGQQWSVDNTTITCSISEPATQDALTDLVNPLINISINDIVRGSNYVSLTGVFDNSSVAADFNWAETGVFAEDDEGNEMLYAYCHTGDQYETIPANNAGKTIAVTLTILVMVGDAEQVSASIGEGSVYATRESLEQHKRDFENPHGVTKEQIGLGNAENVAPADMAITYDAAAALEEPTSGEKMSVFLGKVKKAINNLILHLKAENPHSITPKKIRAAEETHKHSATDITSGILGVSRGGTGVTSTQELANLLGSQFKIPVFGTYTGDGSVKRTIPLEFTPSAVLVVNARGMMGDDIDKVCGGLAVGTKGVRIRSCTAISHETTWSNGHTALLIGTNCFYVSYSGECRTNTSGETYRYIAFR